MKTIVVICVMLSVSGSFAQEFQNFKTGQRMPAQNGCLEITSDHRSVARLQKQADSYKDLQVLKIRAGKKQSFDEALFSQVIPSFTHLKCLVFDHMSIDKVPASFTPGENIRELRFYDCILQDQKLFDLLKKSNVEVLVIVSKEPFISTDSILTAPRIQTIKLSDRRKLQKPNWTDTYSDIKQGTKRDITVSYYGTLFREETKNIAETATGAQQASSTTTRPPSLACVHPPVKDVNIHDTVFTFYSDCASKFTYYSGSEVTVKPGVFRTLTGTPYKGPVNLFYREFRDPVEIMLSGIPMGKVSGDSLSLFKSGGMYEVAATDAKGNELTTNDEKALTIKFALTDTSSNFGFYALNSNGTWSTVTAQVSVTTAQPGTNNWTKAIAEYSKELSAMQRMVPDTTRFEHRFESSEYLYTYRKDNMQVKADSILYITHPSTGYVAKSLFRVKYARQTKDKELLFSIIPVRKTIPLPVHVRPLAGKLFLYDGPLDKSGFRKKFSRQLRCWDLRTSGSGNLVELKIKTDKGFEELSGSPVTLDREHKAVYSDRAASTIDKKVKASLRVRAKIFNRPRQIERATYNHVGDNPEAYTRKAWEKTRKYMNASEQKMSFQDWVTYANQAFMINRQIGDPLISSSVSQALVSSGLGIRNIDEYIHKGCMQEVILAFDEPLEDRDSTFHVMLYKSINTSWPFYEVGHKLRGYYKKESSNYLISFDTKGKMFVTPPKELNAAKKGSRINLPYKEGVNIKGMTSKQITHLIFASAY